MTLLGAKQMLTVWPQDVTESIIGPGVRRQRSRSLGSAAERCMTLDKSPGWSGRGALRGYRHAKMYGSHCRHLFHKCCVDPWLLDHRTCPMCKMNILKALGIPVSPVQPTASSCLSLHVSHSAGRKQHPGFLCPLDPGQWRHVMRAWERFPTSGHIPLLPSSPSENIVTLPPCLLFLSVGRDAAWAAHGLLFWAAVGEAAETPAEARVPWWPSCHSPAPSSGRPSRHALPTIAQLPEETTLPDKGQRGQPLGTWLGGLC